MKKLTFALLLFVLSCARSTEENNSITQNDLIGDWVISEYKFYNKEDLKYIGSLPPTCSKVDIFKLQKDNYLYIVEPSVKCGSSISGDDGTWSYNNKIINFFGDANYVVQNLSKNSIEILDFNEGYVDYDSYYDYNKDGKLDRCTTVLVRK